MSLSASREQQVKALTCYEGLGHVNLGAEASLIKPVRA